MNKKGFTLIELLAVIMLLGIVITLASITYSRYLIVNREKSFEMAEKTLINNTRNAYTDCLNNSNNDFCKNHQSFGSQDELVYLKELIDNNYSEKIKNPYDTNTDCDIESSYVKVIADHEAKLNKSASYQVCLICGNVKSKTCPDE